MIRIEGLYKSFPGSSYTALNDLSLDIPGGSFFTMLGPSGCGKSTTLRCIAGLEQPDAGEITVGGVTVFSSQRRINLPPHKRKIGMVFQSYAIWPHMTVRQNVAYPLKNLRKSRAEIDEAVSWALRLVSLEKKAERPAPLLSGGEQQRVALARALVERPSVLLFDEPLSNLDAKLREDMRRELRDLQQQLAFTALYVTHDQDEAFSLSDAMAVMDAGKIVELGAPEPVYRTPATAFGAEFLGAATRLPGTVLGIEGPGQLRVETALGVVACAARQEFAVGSLVLVYIRPEAVSPANGATDGLIVEAQVEQAAFMGGVLDWRAASRGVTLKGRALAGTRDSADVKGNLNKTLRVRIAAACCVPAKPA